MALTHSLNPLNRLLRPKPMPRSPFLQPMRKHVRNTGQLQKYVEETMVFPRENNEHNRVEWWANTVNTTPFSMFMGWDIIVQLYCTYMALTVFNWTMMIIHGTMGCIFGASNFFLKRTFQNPKHELS